MPGIWDKFKKLGQNLWGGLKGVWDVAKPAVSAVLNTVAPILGPQGQQIANIGGKGIDMGRRIEGALGNMRAPLNSTARRPASILSQQINWEGT
jgi:hypothetical protein